MKLPNCILYRGCMWIALAMFTGFSLGITASLVFPQTSVVCSTSHPDSHLIGLLQFAMGSMAHFVPCLS